MFTKWIKKVKLFIPVILIALISICIIGIFVEENQVYAEEESTEYVEYSRDDYKSDHYYYKISTPESFGEFYLQYLTYYGSAISTFDKCTISLETDFDFDQDISIYTSSSATTKTKTTVNKILKSNIYKGDLKFCGIFVGNGHSISNMVRTSYYVYIGFFDYIGSSQKTYASIDNVNFYNCRVTLTRASSIGDIGVIVGRCYGTVTNCNVYNSTVINTCDAGGIVGMAYGLIYNCNVYNSYIYATAAAGGICGVGAYFSSSSRSKIINCGVYDTKVLNMTDEQYQELGLEYSSGKQYIDECVEAVYDSDTSTLCRGGIVGDYESHTDVINCIFTSTGDVSQAVVQGSDYGRRFSSIYAIGGYYCSNNYFYGTISYEKVLENNENFCCDYVSGYKINSSPTFGKNYFNTGSVIDSILEMGDKNDAAVLVSNPTVAANYMNTYSYTGNYLISKVNVITNNNYQYLSLAEIALNITFKFNDISDEEFEKFASLTDYAFYSDTNYEKTAIDSKVDLDIVFDSSTKTITMSCDYLSEYKYFWYCCGFDGDIPKYVVVDSLFDNQGKIFYGDYTLYSVKGTTIYNEDKTESADAKIFNLDLAYVPSGADVPITVDAGYGYAVDSSPIDNISVISYKDINTISNITYDDVNMDVDISNLDFKLYEAIYKLYYFDMKCSTNYSDGSTLYQEYANEFDTSKALTYQEYAYGEQIKTLINRSDYTEDEYTIDGYLFTNWYGVPTVVESDEGLFMPDSDGFIFAEGSSEYSLSIMIGVRGVNYIDLEGNHGKEDMWLGNHLYISSSKDVLDQNVKGVAIYHDYQSSKEINEPIDQNGYIYTSMIYESLTTTLNFRSNVDFYLFVEYPTGTYYFDIFYYINQIYNTNVNTMAGVYNVLMANGETTLKIDLYQVEVKTIEGNSDYTDNYITDCVGYYPDTVNDHVVSNTINIYPKYEGYKVEVLDTDYYYANNKISFRFDYEKMVDDKIIIEVGARLEHYSIYYFVNDKLWYTDNGSSGMGYVLGDNITYIDLVPESDDCIFSGWSEIPATMPAQSIYIYGNLYEKHEVTISWISDINRTFDPNEVFLSSYSSGSYDEIDKVYVKSFYRSTINSNSINLNFEYIGDKYLWIYDYTLGIYKCLDNYKLDNKNSSLILALYNLTATYDSNYLTVENLGIHLKSLEVRVKITAQTGYRAVSKSSIYEITDNNEIFVNIVYNGLNDDYYFDYEIPLAHEIIKYKLSYIIGSFRALTEEYVYDQEVSMNLDLLEGTEYKTWDNIITNMPAEDVIVHAVKNVSYVIMQSPIISKLHEGQMLSDATISGGILFVDGNQVEGYFYFNNPNTIVYKSDSYNTRFDITFVCTSHPYVAYKFDTEIEVCNPMYSGLLDPLIIVSRRSTTIEFVINDKYEYSYDNFAFFKDSHVKMSALTPDTDYYIYYRYAEDTNYCASQSVLKVIHTMSKDEELYVDTCIAALDFIENTQQELDNKSSEERLIIIKYEYSLPYENRVRSGSEAKSYYDYFTEVFNLTIAIENNRINKTSLIESDASVMDNYSNERIAEIYELAFDKNTQITNLRSYTAYVIGAMDTGDELIGDFLIDKGYDAKALNKLLRARKLDKSKLDNTVNYVLDKVDEIFSYDYEDYEVIDLNEYKNDFVGETVNLQSDIISQVYSHDSNKITATVSLKIANLQAKTYMDYKFDRAQYDKAFLEAAEVAIVCHMQGIVLTNLDNKYEAYKSNLSNIKDINRFLLVYEALKDHYEDYDSFYADYVEIIGDNTEITYDEVLASFDSKLDKELVLPVSKTLNDEEIILIVFFSIAIISGIIVLIVIKKNKKKKGEAHE